MRAGSRTVIPLLAAGALLAARLTHDDPPPPEPAPVEMPYSELTDVQRRALEPLVFTLRWRQRQLRERIEMIRWLHQGRRAARVVQERGGIPLDDELPLVDPHDLPAAPPRPGGCASVCRAPDPRLLDRPCDPVDPAGRWVHLRAPIPSGGTEWCRDPRPARTRTALRAFEVRRELCSIREQLREIEGLLPKSLAARPPEEVLRCLAEESGVQVRFVVAGEPEFVPELGRGRPLRQVSLSAVVEGPPSALQAWLGRLAFMPEFVWSDAVVLHSEIPGSPLVVADARLRLFLWPEPA